MKKATTIIQIVWIISAVIVCFGCAKQKPASEWPMFTSQEGGFGVRFPGTPTQETKNIQPFPAHLFEYKANEITPYVVVYSNVPAQPDPRGPDKIFADARQTLLGKSGKPLQEIPITLNGNSGRELEWEPAYNDTNYGEGFAVAHFFVTPKHFYMVMVTMPSSDRFSTNYWRFLNSFQLLDGK